MMAVVVKLGGVWRYRLCCCAAVLLLRGEANVAGLGWAGWLAGCCPGGLERQRLES